MVMPTKKKTIMERILHRVKRGINHALILVCLSLVWSCSTAKSYHLNEEFKITLPGEGDGGFKWNMVQNTGVHVIDSTSEGNEKDNGFFEYVKIYRFKGLEKGIYQLRFVKKRSFQPELMVDENIQNYKIKIRKK